MSTASMPRRKEAQEETPKAKEREAAVDQVAGMFGEDLHQPFESKKSAELDAERDENVSMNDFETAIDKSQAKDR